MVKAFVDKIPDEHHHINALSELASALQRQSLDRHSVLLIRRALLFVKMETLTDCLFSSRCRSPTLQAAALAPLDIHEHRQ